MHYSICYVFYVKKIILFNAQKQLYIYLQIGLMKNVPLWFECSDTATFGGLFSKQWKTGQGKTSISICDTCM